MVLPALIAAGAALAGGMLSSKSQSDANKANIKYQKQFAQEGIQWRVADAEKAGIHPLYALGAQTTSFSPSVVGDTSMGNALAAAGDNIGRAIAAKSTADELLPVKALTLERMGLENELLRTQIRQLSAAGTPPPMNNNPAGDGDIVVNGVTFLRGADGRLHRVSRPNLASAVQSHYGEGAGDVAGAEAYVVDLGNQGSGPRPGIYRNAPDYYYTGGGF